jgi:hypothetical protein
MFIAPSRWISSGPVRGQNRLISPVVGHGSADCGSSEPESGFVSGRHDSYWWAARGRPPEEILMSVQMVLLPVFVLVGLAFFLLIWTAGARSVALKGRETSFSDIALGQPNWPTKVTQIGNCFANQFEVPVLFYALIALALPLHKADLFIVLMSWVFVVTRFAHAGIFVTTNNVGRRGLVWFAGALVLLAMWIYFALKILLLI